MKYRRVKTAFTTIRVPYHVCPTCYVRWGKYYVGRNTDQCYNKPMSCLYDPLLDRLES